MTNEPPNSFITAFKKVLRQRNQARKEAEDLREVMRVHLDEGPYTFSWEKEEKP